MNANLIRYGTIFLRKFQGVIFSKEILQKVFSKLLTYYFEYRQTENRMCQQQKTMNCRLQCPQKELVSMNYHWQKYSETKICHRAYLYASAWYFFKIFCETMNVPKFSANLVHRFRYFLHICWRLSPQLAIQQACLAHSIPGYSNNEEVRI